MKLLAALLVLVSIHASASTGNSPSLSALKCSTADGIYQVLVATETNAQGQPAQELLINIGSIEARPSMDVYFDASGTYVDNSETSEIHDIQNLFVPALLGFAARNDQAQRYTVNNEPVLLSVASMPELRHMRKTVGFKMRMEIGWAANKRTKTLNCRAKLLI